MKFYKIQEVAEIMSLSRQTIYRYIKDGKIKTVDVAGHRRISQQEIESLVLDKKQQYDRTDQNLIESI